VWACRKDERFFPDRMLLGSFFDCVDVRMMALLGLFFIINNNFEKRTVSGDSKYKADEQGNKATHCTSPAQQV